MKRLPARPRRGPTPASRIALLTPVALLVALGCGKSGPQGPPTPPTPEVTVAQPLIQRTLDWDRYTGRLAAIEEVTVQSRVSGYLLSHHFEEGQIVERGQLLFVIDERPYEAAVARARADREQAIANKSKAEAQRREAEAKREQVIARLDLAKAQLRRARPLVPSGAISQDEYDVLISEARQAEADTYAADAEIESAKAAVSAAEAGIATAEAAERAAQLDLDYCRIEAPIAGRIGRREVTAGNLVSGGLGASRLTSIVSIDPIHAYFDASERELMKYIRLDRSSRRKSSRDTKTPVYMALVDEEGFPHQGYIDFVDNQVDRSTGSIRARAIFPNREEVLTPGVFIKAMIPGSAPYDAVLIPDSAITTDQATKIVYVLGEGDTLEARPVTLGSMSRDLRVVRSGLTGEDTVVIAGLQRCRPGSRVKPSTGEITLGPDDGLPDEYRPVPPEEWLTPPVGLGDSALVPETPRPEAPAVEARGSGVAG